MNDNNNPPITPRQVDIDRLLGDMPFSGMPLRVTLLGLLVLILDGFDIQAVAFAAPALVTKWGIERSALGAALAAGLVGMGLGAALFGWFADRWGRRRALLVGVVVFAIGSIVCATASNLQQLIVYRLVTGIGLGAPLPVATALMAEFAPLRWRSMSVGIAVIGIPLGGMLGAALAQSIVPLYGWQAIFIAGGVLPAVLFIVLLSWLPESPRYLATQLNRGNDLAALLNRASKRNDFRGDETFLTRESGPKPGLFAILGTGYRVSTLTIWVIFFTNLFVIYLYFNWLPTVLAAAGMSVANSIRGSLIFNLGGVIGALLVAFLMTQYHSRPIVSLVAAGSAIGTAAIGLTFGGSDGANSALLMWMVALAGACTNGVQIGMYSLAAGVYATPVRATGVGWASTFARVGGICSTLAGAAFFASGFTNQDLFIMMAAVLVITAIAIALLRGHVAAPAA